MLRTARLCRSKLSVCPSVTVRYDYRIGWNTSNIISWLISLGSSGSDIVSLLKMEQHEMLARIGLDNGKSGSRRIRIMLRHIERQQYASKFTTASRGFPATSRFYCYIIQVCLLILSSIDGY